MISFPVLSLASLFVTLRDSCASGSSDLLLAPPALVGQWGKSSDSSGMALYQYACVKDIREYTVAIQENLCKMQYRWYLTPYRLNKMFLTADPTCWSLKPPLGDCLHIWWLCPLVKMVGSVVAQVAGVTLEFSPKTLLLNIIYIKKNRKEKALIGNTLIAAKA